jgi:hypothetical protein
MLYAMYEYEYLDDNSSPPFDLCPNKMKEFTLFTRWLLNVKLNAKCVLCG